MLRSALDRGDHRQVYDIDVRIDREMVVILRDAATCCELFGTLSEEATNLLDRAATLRNRRMIAHRAFNARIDALPTYWGL